jgi:hypothetical protein
LSLKIFQIVPNTIPRLVQVSNNELYDGNGNPISSRVGPQGDAGLSFSWMGTYVTSITYSYYNIIEYDGTSFIYLGSPAFGITPSTTTQSWAILASRGFQGRTGPQGIQGVQGPQGIQGPTSSFILRTESITTQTYSITFDKDYFGVNYTIGTCGVTLPSAISPTDDGKFFVVSDETGTISHGNRGIHLIPQSGQLINGYSDVIMKINWMSLNLMFRNNSWKTI